MSGIDHPLGLMGWGDTKLSHEVNAGMEYLMFRIAEKDNPVAYRERAPRQPLPEMLQKWNDFQLSKGREAGSVDMTLLTEFVFGKKFYWFPQDTGSCVFSNTFRAWVARMCAEIVINGDAEEYFGTDELGYHSVAPHMISYGFARQRANMRSGDGLYCEPLIESFMKDGVVSCATPKLKETMDMAGARRPEDYPEPRDVNIIRRLQNWEFNDRLRPYADFRLLESTLNKSGDDLDRAAKAFKPSMNCSGIAIKIKGKHPDGFTIHTQDTSTSWGHNMSWQGIRVAKNGDVFDILSNESWIQRGSSNPEKYIYHIERSESDRWMKRDSVTSMTIGEIDGPKSSPVSI